MKPVLLSGIQPSGKLHIGNYLGALKNFAEPQNSGKYDCFFFIADLHALTEVKSRNDIKKNTEDLLLDYLAAGLNPKKSTLFIQSRILEHAVLSWIFNCLIPVGELERMTQFKDKTNRGLSANVGLFTYPALMAADILIYKAEYIPVGEDQKQHLEITRTIARNFNQKFGRVFPEPKGLYTQTPRIMSFSSPAQKMSKSAPEGCIFLGDSPKTIKEKIARAVTDSEKTIDFDLKNRPGITNLISVYSEFSGLGTQEVVRRFQGKGYAEFKSELANLLIEKLKPFQKRRKELAENLSFAEKIFAEGSQKARLIAQKTMTEVKTKMGL